MRYILFKIQRFYTYIIIGVCFPLFLNAQGSGVPLGSETYHLMDRLEIKTGITPPFHSMLKYYNRGDVTKYAIALDTADIQLSKFDRLDLQYIFRDNNEWLGQSHLPTPIGGKKEPAYKRRYVDSTQTFYTLEETKAQAASIADVRYVESERPILRYLYRTPANAFELNKDYFYIKLNPILNFKIGRDGDDSEIIFLNRRGLELRGGVDDRVFFYTNILETQARFPEYVYQERIRRDKAVPGAGFFKNYTSNVFNITNNGYDFLNAQGYVGFNITNHIGFQFGHGRNFVGDGYRSMMLSDYANNYLYLKFNTRVWRFHLQNIFGELALRGSEDDSGDFLIPKKFFAAHHLSFRLTPHLTFGIFESIVFTRNNNFELQYLNPVILYRTVEQAIGSSDNLILGFDAKWNLFKRFSLYGQFVLDEFKFDELITDNQGWWANKYAVQIGLKYIDVLGIDHLDAQVEFNTARPYTYTHRDSSASYSHFNQPLAHPLGANFQEYIFKLRYQPIKKLLIEPRLILAKVGEDTKQLNWGNNILTPTQNNFINEYGNVTGQGVQADITILAIDVSYQILHNVFIDLHYFSRDKVSQDPDFSRKTNYIGGGVRVNINNRNLDF